MATQIAKRPEKLLTGELPAVAAARSLEPVQCPYVGVPLAAFGSHLRLSPGPPGPLWLAVPSGDQANAPRPPRAVHRLGAFPDTLLSVSPRTTERRAVRKNRHAGCQLCGEKLLDRAGGVGTRPSTQPGRTATAGTEAPISVRRCVRGCGRDLPNTRKTVCGVGNRCCSGFSEERRWSVAEPFMDFVDRVRASVEKRVQNPELQDQLTLEIATTNANEACQRVILALPASPPPTLDQLIEECTRKATLMTEDSVISPRERVVASAAATPRTPGSAGPPPYQGGKVGVGGIFFLYTGRANCTFFRVSLPCYMILSFFQTSRMSISTFLLIVWFQTMAIYPYTVDAWIVPQPKKNVWVTLAQALKQDHMCLSTASAENPMSTCLVGVPSKGDEFPIGLVRPQKQVNENKIPEAGTEFYRHRGAVEQVKIPVQNPLILWQKWILHLPSAEGEPQELELLGSAKAEYCIQFDFSPTKEVKLYEQVKQYKVEFRAGQWCTAVYKLKFASTTDFRPRKLDKGVFLICGDRAYPGIPSRLIGGPCTFGHLTLASPNMTQIPIR
nr:uncharacterized protein LOC116808529 [Taeniopygia guttata]